MDRVLLSNVPALPASVSELIRLRPTTPSYYERVLAICEADAGMASEVLRFAHSVSVGSRGPLASIRQALLLVGPRPAVNHLLRGALVRVFVPHAPVVRRLWEHTVWCAAACERLASDHQGPHLDPHVAYAAGLLHDLGRLAVACVDQDRYAPLLEECGTDVERLLDTERRTYGEDHARIGARIVGAWGFSRLIHDVVLHHHRPQAAAADDEASGYVRIVALADALADHRDDEAMAFAAEAGLPLESEDAELIRRRIDEGAREVVERLGLDVA